MTETTPDKSNRDQISLLIRYVNENFDIKKRLVKMSEIKSKTGSGLSNAGKCGPEKTQNRDTFYAVKNIRSKLKNKANKTQRVVDIAAYKKKHNYVVAVYIK